MGLKGIEEGMGREECLEYSSDVEKIEKTPEYCEGLTAGPKPAVFIPGLPGLAAASLPIASRPIPPSPIITWYSLAPPSHSFPNLKCVPGRLSPGSATKAVRNGAYGSGR